MRLDKTMSEFTVKTNPEYSQFRDRNGAVTVLLRKALYGCVQSAALWYGNLGRTLRRLEYVRNETDICVYSREGKDGVQCMLCIHVDDLQITSVNKRTISELTEGLRTGYGEITLKRGPLLNSLGISLDFSLSGEARLTMSGHLSEILMTLGVTGTAQRHLV